MRVILLKDATPGLILAQNIEDDFGRALVGAGEILTADLIRVLMRRGFAEIPVRESVPVQPAKPVKPSATGISSALAALEDRFANATPGDAAMQMLKRVAMMALAVNSTQGSTGDAP